MAAGCTPVNNQTSKEDSRSAKWVCSEDGMICPNGNVLSRFGPDCEFPPCS